MHKNHQQNPELSICTVSYNSSDWIRLNLSLVKSTNKNSNFHWVIVENSSQNSKQRVTQTGNDFEILEGPLPKNRPYAKASYHHGDGLNLGVSRISTRFLLILDPDFFIIRENWINEILSYMKRNEISILGAPWHPKRYKKWRYFPCAHCTFIDLTKIDKTHLNFLPDYEQFPRIDKNFSRRNKKAIKLLDPLKLLERRYIGHSADTGFRIYQYYANKLEIKSECLTPVYSPSWISKVFNAPFHDKSSLIPKQTNYYSSLSFADYRLPDFKKHGCEEFLWRNQPFGFHVRSFPKRNNLENSLSVIFKEIKHFVTEKESNTQID